MWLTLDDLRCHGCGAYVHPLLDTCPSCGAARSSRREDAAAGPIGAVRLAEAPETQRVARNISMRYTMKVNAVRSGQADATLVDAVAHLAEALTYRLVGDALPGVDNASVSLRDEILVAQRRPSGALLAELPVRSIVGAASRHGEVSVFYSASLAAGPGTGSSGDQPRRLTLANRRGLLAARARDDHFESLACWLAVLAAAAAERRWTEVGLAAYLAELGPVAGGPAEPAVPGASPAAVTGGPAGPPSSIQASLVELERLRAAGLLVDAEYADKRREILARL